MLEEPPESGGGNIHFKTDTSNRITIRRSLAIGDVLCSTAVATKLAEQGFSVDFKSHPATHCVLRRHPAVARALEPDGPCDIDLDGCYENDKHRNTKHFHQMFFAKANEDIQKLGISIGKPLNCTPRISVSTKERKMALNTLEQYPRPWTFIVPRSQNYAARTVPDYVWGMAATKIPGTKFWLGMHPGPTGIVDLSIKHFDLVIRYLSVADLLLTTDTGPMHVAAALRTPIIVLSQSSSPDWHLSDQNDFQSIYPEGNLDCLDCQKNVCPKVALTPPCQNFHPEVVANAANNHYNGDGKISAAVSVYRPRAEVLNKCLEHLLPQVHEIVVCRDKFGEFPTPKLDNPKIRYVIKNDTDIGYGRKQNYCVRHTTGEFVLLVNDDVFLDPGAVKQMHDLMMTDASIGMVSNLLRYPNGTIYHAGKVRSPGVRGWGHIDHRKYEPTFRSPALMENVCGACILVRRKAFYSVNGFDERFYLYAEDDDMSLSFRKAGWKLFFHPGSTGVHMEHQSTEKTPRITEIVNNSNRTFSEKWGRYLDHNIQRVPGDFDYV